MRASLKKHSRTLFVAGAIGLAAFVIAGIVMEGAGQQLNLRAETSPDAQQRALEVFTAASLARGESLYVASEAYQSRAPFELFLVDCDGLAQLRGGNDPTSPLAKTSSTFSAKLEVREQHLRNVRDDCSLHGVVRWSTPAPPEDAFSQSHIHFSPTQTPLGRAMPLGALVAGVVMALGVALGDGIFRVSHAPPPRDASPLETAVLLAIKGEIWLARTRTYLLVLGIVAFVPLYLLIAGVFIAIMRGANAAEPLRWIVIAAAALAIVGTAGWLRRLREADLELRAWREHVARLRAIEDDVLA